MKKFSFHHNWKKIPAKVFLLWLRHYKLLFLLLFVMVTAWGGYEWRRNLFVYHWSPEDRQRYLEATIKETAFQEERFLETIKNLEQIASDHVQSVIPTRDLFIGTKDEDDARY